MTTTLDFLSVLHPPGSTFSVCAFREHVLPAVEFALTPEEGWANAARIDASAQYDGVYHCVPNLKAKPETGRGTAKDALNVCAVWADVDALDFEPLSSAVTEQMKVTPSRTDAKNEVWKNVPQEQKDTALSAVRLLIESVPCGPPSILVFSGRGYHPYWLLTKSSENLELARSVNREIMRIVHGDNCADLARVLKVPGTHNRKNPDQPVLSEIVSFDSMRRYALDAIYKAIVPPVPVQVALIVATPLSIPEQNRIDRAKKYVSKMPPAVSGQKGHVATFKAAFAVARGFDLDAATTLGVLRECFNPRCVPPWDDEDLAHKAKQARENSDQPLGYLLNGDGKAHRHATDDAPRDRPTIIVRNELGPVVAEAQQALVQYAGNLFVRSGLLVSVAKDSAKDVPGLVRPPHAPVIVPVSQDRLRALLDESARWITVREDKKTHKTYETDALPPAWVAASLHTQGSWPFRPLEGISENPILRVDGSIVTQPGYDDNTATWYDPGHVAFPHVPEKPSRKDALASLAIVEDLITDFPFATEDIDKAVVISAIFTLVAREAIPGPCPMFVFRSPTPGSGKGLLSDVVSLISTGRVAARLVSPKDDEEARKRILSIALEGTRLILLDNVDGALGSAALANALTADTFSDRLLGTQRMAIAPMRAVWIANGNNVTFQGDLGRRVLPCDLDPKMEHPEERTNFAHPDLRTFVSNHRPEIVSAILTCLSAYFSAGKPHHGLPPMGSFESWDALIRGCVIWLGLKDPLLSQTRIREEGDSDLSDLRNLLSAWFAYRQNRAITVAELIGGRGGPDYPDQTLADQAIDKMAHDAVRDAIVAFDPRGNPTFPNTRLIGIAMNKLKDRIVDGFVLRSVFGLARGGKLWKVENVSLGEPGENG